MWKNELREVLRERAALDDVELRLYPPGRIKENITEAEIVTRQGEVEQVKDEKFTLVSGCEGRTGVITKVTQWVGRLKRTSIRAAVFPKFRDAALALKQIGEEQSILIHENAQSFFIMITTIVLHNTSRGVGDE